MAAEYYIQLRDPSGVKIAVITDYLDLSYAKKVNEPGLATIKLDANSPVVALFTTNAQIEIWRRNPDTNINWYCDFYGLFRSEERATPFDRDVFTAMCPGQMTILSWAHVMYYDGYDTQSIFTQLPAETVMKDLVKWNVTSSATTANGRFINWPTSGLYGGITNEVDAGRGNVIDWKCPRKNLLTELQDVAKIANGDFDFVKTGNLTWQFKFYPGQLGVDRTASVVFSIQYGNMANPIYIFDKINSSTLAVVGGRGESYFMNYQIVYGDLYNATNNYIETFVSANDYDTPEYLQAKGKERLYLAKERRHLSFQVLQTPSTQYGRDYFMGDLITANYNSIIFQQEIRGITINFSDGQETVDIEMRER